MFGALSELCFSYSAPELKPSIFIAYYILPYFCTKLIWSNFSFSFLGKFSFTSVGELILLSYGKK